MKEIITDSELGNILLIKNPRSKRLILKIKKEGDIELTMPVFSSKNEALDFIRNKREWIIRSKEKIQSKKQLISNENPIQTFSFRVELKPAYRRDFYIKLSEGKLSIEHPSSISCEDEKSQKIFKQAIEKALKFEAKRLLPSMIKDLSCKHDFVYKEIKITSSKSRWGSCSNNGNINISYFLLLLPTHLIQYVLLHELCHTKEMNHGPKFWNLMNKVTENEAKKLAKEIKKYNTCL